MSVPKCESPAYPYYLYLSGTGGPEQANTTTLGLVNPSFFVREYPPVGQLHHDHEIKHLLTSMVLKALCSRFNQPVEKV